MAVYGKIIRFTMPLNHNQILLITIANKQDPPKILNRIENILENTSLLEKSIYV